MIGEIFKCIFAGIGVALEAIFKTIPLINEINGIKEILIAAALGVPVFLVSIVFSIPTIVKIINKLIN